MGYQADSELVDARERLVGPVGEPRKLDAVVGRQVLTDLDDLMLDEVVVVEQPFTGRSDDAPPLSDLVEVGVVGGQSCGRLRGQLQQWCGLGSWLARDLLAPGDLTCRLSQPVRTEQLGSERSVVRRCPNRLGGLGHARLPRGDDLNGPVLAQRMLRRTRICDPVSTMPLRGTRFAWEIPLGVSSFPARKQSELEEL